MHGGGQVVAVAWYGGEGHGGIVVTVGGVVWLSSMGIGRERGRWVSERVIISAVAMYLVMCVQSCTCKNTCSVVNS